jgi:hypothetical protein
MYDVMYLLGSIAFFALMLAYVSGCERLGGSSAAGPTSSDGRP